MNKQMRSGFGRSRSEADVGTRGLRDELSTAGEGTTTESDYSEVKK